MLTKTLLLLYLSAKILGRDNSEKQKSIFKFQITFFLIILNAMWKTSLITNICTVILLSYILVEEWEQSSQMPSHHQCLIFILMVKPICSV